MGRATNQSKRLPKLWPIVRHGTKAPGICLGFSAHACLVITACLALLFMASPAHACSVCQGDPNSNMVKAAQGGVVVMVLVTYAVLMLFIVVVGAWFVRARRLARGGRDGSAASQRAMDSSPPSTPTDVP